MDESFEDRVRKVEDILNPWNHSSTEQLEKFEQAMEALCKAQALCLSIERNAFDCLDPSTKKEIIYLYTTQKANPSVVSEWLADFFADELILLFKELVGEQTDAYHKFIDAAVVRFEEDFHEWFKSFYAQRGGDNAYNYSIDDEIKLSKEA